MTLNTTVRVLDPIDIHEFFRRGQLLLAERDDERRAPERQKSSDRELSDGQWCIGNRIGQGLPGIWDVDYCQDGPLRAEDDGHDEDCDADCSGRYHGKACYAQASLDTSYGYKDAHGGCGDLHAWFVGNLGLWLDEQGARWEFQDEGTGEWYSSAADLKQIASSGAEAQDWFRRVAYPAILAHAASEGVEVRL